MKKEEEKWSHVIKPQDSLFDLKLGEVWRYRDLLVLFVRRDFVSRFKQTILGPLWFFVQPLLTSLMYVLTFGTMAKLPTDGIPPILFYMSGSVMWSYFVECLMGTSNTFSANQHLFGKVYFPRLVVPLSILISSILKLGVQLLLFLTFLGYFLLSGNQSVHVNLAVLPLFPLLVVLLALQGLGFGMLITALTTKYRDLQFLLSFGVQLAMYATPIVYPLSMVPEKYKWILLANPFTGIIETFRYMFTGAGSLNVTALLLSATITFVAALLGILVFNKTEKTFIDTV